jgi:D-aminopeptidase
MGMRARQLGIEIGFGVPGTYNAITDVAGVLVGHATIVHGDGPLVVGEGPVRTGVTVVLPHDGVIAADPVFAGAATLNGNGELTGLAWVRESGFLMSPIGLTNSHSVGVVRDALVADEIGRRAAGAARKGTPRSLYWSLPVVGETWDGLLNDIDGRHVTERHVEEALAAATGGPVAEGSVGGGTGMVCHDFKGGIGAASRLVDCVDGAAGATLVRAAVAGLAGDGAAGPVAADARRFTVGVLVQANHGGRERFQVNGAPVGQVLHEGVVPLPVTPEERAAAALASSRRRQGGAAAAASDRPEGAGSIVVIIATDAPLLPHQCERLARRAGLGVGALGAYGGHYSGDLFLCFSTAARGLPAGHYCDPSPVSARVEVLSGTFMDGLFEAVVEATQEAVLNALLQAGTMVGRDGVTAHALDGDRLLEILDGYGRRHYRV